MYFSDSEIEVLEKIIDCIENDKKCVLMASEYTIVKKLLKDYRLIIQQARLPIADARVKREIYRHSTVFLPNQSLRKGASCPRKVKQI